MYKDLMDSNGFVKQYDEEIAAAMDNRGLLISNDPEPARARVLAGNLERMGAANAIVVNALPGRLAPRWKAAFDAVLVDAPPRRAAGLFHLHLQ